MYQYFMKYLHYAICIDYGTMYSIAKLVLIRYRFYEIDRIHPNAKFMYSARCQKGI